MDDGLVGEMGQPQELLSRPISLFSSFVDQCGEQQSQHLRRIAATAAGSRVIGVLLRPLIDADARIALVSHAGEEE